MIELPGESKGDERQDAIWHYPMRTGSTTIAKS